MVENVNFTFYRSCETDSEKSRKSAINFQKECAAEAIIGNYKSHKGNDEKAYIPTSVFDKGKTNDLDENGDGKIDKDEIVHWLEKMDIKDDNEDGTISPDTMSKFDNFDLLGFKSGQIETLNKKTNLKSAEKGIKKINEWAGNKFIMFFAESYIVKGMGKKPAMDFMLGNESTRNLFIEMKGLNPDLVKNIIDNAYGEEAPKIFEGLKF